MSFFEAAHEWGGEGANRSPLPKICHLYPVMMKSGTVRLKPNEIPKNLRIT